MHSLTLATPTGPITLTESDGTIIACRWEPPQTATSQPPTPLLQDAADQITAYFNGTLHAFDLALNVRGTGFQQQVCAAIAAIPFGETRTYGDLARDLGVSAQAVGRGCGGNPIPILIPCHRVLGANGLGGFSGLGGVETKVWLLRHEGGGGLLI
ncbi:methylated-DNA-[protein]-cysteine S-methyltransferase [Thalassovita litoralis]|jgi:methylated-DNA-[protein]-cysteine S-methyltransferase|uniref:Methylated-DNA--protein-cysteine methyltransferase n=1 Tax=Thalassovita litoralis TaxID=1010611 RepID=A0A521EZ27_9RHOB|nr:methylated-DNA--[protein]-cysteine S-methyltransferase [Thalassovita litoralis]SMO88691.1 methylated-DNA-[protein]-cysteine S-methyltransferase [Thalassovita litoralis]